MGVEKGLLDYHDAEVQPDQMFNYHKCAQWKGDFLSLEDVWVSMVASQVSAEIPLCPHHYS